MGGDSGGGRGGNPNKRRGSWSDSDDNNNNNNNSRTAGSSSSSSSSWSSSTDDNNKRSRRSFYDKQEYEQHQHQQSRDYYEILDVPRNATLDDIKKAYRRLAIKYHPDKNKEHDACDKFREITQAYEVLSNQEKRDTYDRFGQAGLQGGGGMHFTNAEDLFSQFFTSSGLYQEVFGSHYGRSDRCGASSSASSSSDKKKKGEDVVHTLRVTLEDMYKGITKRLRITRMIKCSECIGQGTKAAAEKKSCPKCRGSGTTQTSEMMRHHQVGGQGQGQGYAQQQQQQFQSTTTTTTSTCTMCNGEGRVSIERSSKDDHHHHHYHRCVACQGKSMVEEKKEIDVPIRPGIRDGERIIFERQANDLPDCDAVPGDIIIVVRQKPHSTFTRMPGHQHHLLMQRKIKLVEALCGLEFTFNHLDGRSIWVSYKRGELIYDGDIKKITGEGMCYSENSPKRGDLYIKFDIEFPLQGSLSEKNREALEANLPPREPMPADRTGYHFVNLEDANISAELMKEQFEDDDIAEQGEDDRIHTRDYYGGGDDVGDGRDDRRSGTCSQQ